MKMERSGATTPPRIPKPARRAAGSDGAAAAGLNSLRNIAAPGDRGGTPNGNIRQFFFAYKHQPETLHIDEAVFPFGGATAIIGHNGQENPPCPAACAGWKKRCGGIVRNQVDLFQKRRLKLCYMVMQDVNHQLFTESVLDELFLRYEYRRSGKGGGRTG